MLGAFPDEGVACAVRGLLIPVDGPPEVVGLASGGGMLFMQSLRALIGAECVERFRVTDRWEFWVDEDGRAAGKVINEAASRVARDFGVPFSFLGGVVITGVDDAVGSYFPRHILSRRGIRVAHVPPGWDRVVYAAVIRK